MIKDLFKDLAKYLPSYIVPTVVGIIAIPIITRMFPPEDYGNYVLVLAVASVLSAFATAWLNASIIRFYPAYKVDNLIGTFQGTIVKLTLISVADISIIILTVLYIVMSRISPNFYFLMRIGLLVFIVTSVFRVILSELRTNHQITWYSFFSIWPSTIGLAFGVILVIVFHYGVEALLWGSFLSIAIVLPFLWKISIGKISLKDGYIHSLMTSEITQYGLLIILVNLASWIIMLSDRYVINFFCGSGKVGIYSAGYAIPQRSILIIASLFALASNPIAFNIWEKQGFEASQKFLTKITLYYLLIGFPAKVGLAVLSKPIMHVLTAPAYFSGYIIIPLISFSSFFVGISNNFDQVLAYYKKTNLTLFNNLICASLNLGLNFLFIIKYGFIAAAVTTFIAFVVDLLIKIIVSRHFLIWQFPFVSLERTAIASAVIG